ncbi:hypothetical protein JHK87_050872 [Glycine soja]|nr:hypothetical protein JHK87_050872 [Glycine soja]
MANQSPPFGTPLIGLQYCAPDPVDLIITKERTIRDNFTVTDVNGNIVFTVQSSLVTFVTPRQHLFLLDADGNPLVHLRRATLCLVVKLLPHDFNNFSFYLLLAANDNWKAFRGRSTESKDLIFIRKPSSFFQLMEKLNVFLANNTTEVCDFKVKATRIGYRSWNVYIGESDIVVAQINKKPGTMFSREREKYMVTVCPNIDYAFIVSLIVTLLPRHEQM